MKVVDLKTDGKGMKFSVAGHMATIILKRGKKFTEADLAHEGFTAEEINRHRDVAQFLIAINKWGQGDRIRSWLERMLRWLSI